MLQAPPKPTRPDWGRGTSSLRMAPGIRRCARVHSPDRPSRAHGAPEGATELSALTRRVRESALRTSSQAGAPPSLNCTAQRTCCGDENISSLHRATCPWLLRPWTWSVWPGSGTVCVGPSSHGTVQVREGHAPQGKGPAPGNVEGARRTGDGSQFLSRAALWDLGGWENAASLPPGRAGTSVHLRQGGRWGRPY